MTAVSTAIVFVSSVTLTGVLTDSLGVPAVGTVTLTLCNFGGVPPRIVGSSMLATVVTSVTTDANGVFTISFYGNHQIKPVGTYYEVKMTPNYGGGFSANYRFTSDGTYDISTLTPLNAPTTQRPLAGSSILPVFVDEETPTGTINSTDGTTGNAVFTLLHTPSPLESLNLYKNGLRMQPGVAYTITGSTITYLSGYIPLVGNTHVCSYRCFA